MGDEVAIITGGTRGIGAAIAIAIAKRGVRLVLNGRGRDAEVDATLAELGPSAEVAVHYADAAEAATAAALVELARSRFGRLDYVVAAAGGANPGKITDLSFAQWDDAFRVHVAEPAIAVPVLVGVGPTQVLERDGVLLRPRVELVVEARRQIRPVLEQLRAAVAIGRDDGVAIRHQFPLQRLRSVPLEHCYRALP